MANLTDIAASLDVDLHTKASNPKNETAMQKTEGKKRRVWLEEQGENQKTQKGSINPVYKPRSSTPFINPVHQPHSNKGSIHPITNKGSIDPLLKSNSMLFKNLRGNPLKIVCFLHNLTKKEGKNTTRKITFKEIMETLNLSRDSVKTAIRFLIKKKAIQRVDFKIGKSGWSKYQIEKKLHKETAKNIQKGFINPISYKGSIDPIAQKGFNSSSSSLLNNINKTTTEDLPIGWQEIDFNSLSEIGFSNNHLAQLHKLNKYKPEEIQNSIHYFTYDLKYNNRAQKITKSTPLAYFMSTLKNYGLIAAPKNYESPQDVALREYVENQKALVEKRKKMVKELKDVEYESWKASLSDDDIEKIKPGFKHYGSDRKNPMTIGVLYKHFEENIWPKIHKKFLEKDFKST